MSDAMYVEIYKKYGKEEMIEAIEANFLAIAGLMELYRVGDKMQRFKLKSSVINHMADIEISMKMLKKVIGISDPIGSGILVSAKRNKLDAMVQKAREEL